jgi:hypothetical protein
MSIHLSYFNKNNTLIFNSKINTVEILLWNYPMVQQTI